MAKRLITGVDADGRSCVVEEIQCEDRPADKRSHVQTMFQTSTDLPPRPSGQGAGRDMGVPAGTVRWIRTQLAPGEFLNHHTDTLDFDTVVRGYVDLLLDDGDHRLEVGDSVVITGVDHGWRPGPDGVVMSVVLIGTPERG